MPILAVLAIIVGASAVYLYATYGTVSPCEALGAAYEEDNTEILGEMAVRDPAFALSNVGRAPGDWNSEETQRLAALFRIEADKRDDVLRCTYLVAYRAFDRQAFRETVAQEFLRNGQPQG